MGAGRIQTTNPMSNFLETLKERVVVFDGAMGTSLQAQHLTLDDFGGPLFEGCNENLLVTRPDAVERVHSLFLEAGCDGYISKPIDVKTFISSIEQYL